MIRALVLAVGSVLVTLTTTCQVYTPIPITCSSDLPDEVNDFSILPCHLAIENLSIDALEQEDFFATSGVTIGPDTDLDVTNGEVNIFLQPPTLDLAWFEPENSIYSVPVYEKMEIGVDLPQALDDAIDAFILDPNDPAGLNPYNPNDIDAYAIISGPTGEEFQSERINLFFYQEFTRNHPHTSNTVNWTPSNTAQHYGLWDWEDEPTDYRFRLRYAPRSEGTYSVSVVLDSQGSQDVATTFQFEATPALDPRGFVKRSGQTRYLEFENDELFFPIGHQVGAHDKGIDWEFDWERKYVYDAGCMAQDLDGDGVLTKSDRVLDCNECVIRNTQPWGTYESHPKTYCQAFFMKSLDELEELKAAGANAGRVVMMPWSYELEYEDLGNYGSRMHCAWEFDRFLDKAHSEDMHLIVNLQSQYPLQYGPFGSLTNWDWETDACWTSLDECSNSTNPMNSGYCYHEEMPNLEQPLDFFTDPDALEIYKRKIRYYIARYGYSKHIAYFELLAEANACQQILGPQGWDADNAHRSVIQLHDIEPYAAEALQVWHEQIAQYIKEELGHTEHLLAVHYLLDGPPEETGDDSYGIPWVDINSESRYTVNFMEPFDGSVDHASNEINHHLKPYLFAEYGIPHKFEECSYKAPNTRGILLSGFNGTLGIGFNWDMWKNQDHETWSLYEGVNQFFSDLDLNNTNWLPVGTQTSTFPEIFGEQGQNGNIPPKSIIGLHDHDASINDQIRMVGAICNNTFNSFTTVEWTCECYNPNGSDSLTFDYPDQYLGTWDVGEDGEPLYWQGLYDGNLTNLDWNDPYKLEVYVGMQSWPYSINYFDPFTGQYLNDEPYLVTSDQYGLLELSHPNLVATTNPIVYFELWDAFSFGGVRSSSGNDTYLVDVSSENQTETQSNEIFFVVEANYLSCTPNPFKHTCLIEWTSEQNGDLQVVSSDGRVVLTKVIDAQSQTHLTLEPGHYLVRVVSNQEVYTEQIIGL